MPVFSFATALAAAEAELLELQWPAGRNPRAPWDGGHFALPGEPRPLSVSRTEARFLANLVGLLDCRVVLEVGTGFGYSTAWLARGLSLCSAPRGVYTVDDHSEGPGGERAAHVARSLWEQTGVARWVHPIRGTSPQVLAGREPVRAELAFIDGAHHGDQPLWDYHAVRHHLTEEGCLVFHDVQAKYDVHAAVLAAMNDGFTCVPLNSSANPIVAFREPSHHFLIRAALSLAKRDIVLGSERRLGGQ